MQDHLIGREEEARTLEQFLTSKAPEFLAIYGRRRVGKTFLIRTFFSQKKAIFFDVTGTKDGSLAEQVRHFTQQIGAIFYNGARLEAGNTWDAAFGLLTDAIKGIESNQKVVLFFDEFPWMATKNSKLLQTLDYYWNQHWSKDQRIKLIICGSSASWIINRIVNNRGGLHNRLTHHIHLEPFNLRDTKRFLNQLGIKLTDKQILQLYMVMGGIPYYLSKIEKGLSAAQNIEKLAFQKKGFLLNEFDNLFASLFDDHIKYIEIVRTIAKSRYGIGQEELLSLMGKAFQGKGGITKLKELQDTGFIASFKPQLHKRKGIHYKVIDEYSLFYFHWIEPIKQVLAQKSLTKGYWEKHQSSAAWYSWAGYAFESVCYEHLPQIMTALDLSPTSLASAWRYAPRKGSTDRGAQIDLLFDRNDDAITLCEIKYTNEPYAIDKAYAQKLAQKMEVFKKITRTKKQLLWAIISANGLKKNFYSEEMISQIVTLEDLHKK